MFGQSRFLKPEKMLIVAALKANTDKALRVFFNLFFIKKWQAPCNLFEVLRFLRDTAAQVLF